MSKKGSWRTPVKTLPSAKNRARRLHLPPLVLRVWALAMHALAEARDQSDAVGSSHAASVAATERSLVACVAASLCAFVTLGALARSGYPIRCVCVH